MIAEAGWFTGLVLTASAAAYAVIHVSFKKDLSQEIPDGKEEGGEGSNSQQASAGAD
jgi:hypothetical protein